MNRTNASTLVGILGGMSWESTVTYYQEMNRRYHERYGGYHSAPLLIHSVDFEPVEAMQRRGDWDAAAQILGDAAVGLERAGADLLLLATNTMHLVFDQLLVRTTAPWIHIADATGEALRRDGIRRVGLLGTRFTMEEPFYRDRLSRESGLDVIVPEVEDRRMIDETIFRELVHGEIRTERRDTFITIIERLASAGAEAVILGCTEIGLLISPEHTDVPLYDTTLLHVAAAVDRIAPPATDTTP